MKEIFTFYSTCPRTAPAGLLTFLTVHTQLNIHDVTGKPERISHLVSSVNLHCLSDILNMKSNFFSVDIFKLTHVLFAEAMEVMSATGTPRNIIMCRSFSTNSSSISFLLCTWSLANLSRAS